MAFLDKAGLNYLLSYITLSDSNLQYGIEALENSIPDVWPVSSGGTGATAAGTTLLSNIGITSGTADAPATGTPGTIYIKFA